MKIALIVVGSFVAGSITVNEVKESKVLEVIQDRDVIVQKLGEQYDSLYFVLFRERETINELMSQRDSLANYTLQLLTDDKDLTTAERKAIEVEALEYLNRNQEKQ